MLSLSTLIVLGIVVFILILIMTLTSVKWAYRFEHKIDALPPTVEQQEKGDRP